MEEKIWIFLSMRTLSLSVFVPTIPPTIVTLASSPNQLSWSLPSPSFLVLLFRHRFVRRRGREICVVELKRRRRKRRQIYPQIGIVASDSSQTMRIDGILRGVNYVDGAIIFPTSFLKKN